MANLSQQKRERMLKFLETIKAEHTDDEAIIALNEIENELNSKKYGLVWEQHEEAVDEQMRTHVPVFTEVKEREIKDNSDDEGYNFLLEGDNLHSLKLLEKTHRGKIDVIYIDPPYNTKNKDFAYNDKKIEADDSYRHSKWLSFMYERLKIAYNLMSKTGVIFISIDDNEISNLRLLCDEVFGESNFINQITLLCNPKGRSQDKYFATCHEYLLVYSKSVLPSGFFSVEKSEDRIMSDYKLEDERGKYRLLELRNTHREFDRSNRPNLWYPIYVNSNSKKESSISLEKTKDFDEAVYPIWKDGHEGCWTWGKPKVSETPDMIVAKKTAGQWKIYRKAYATNEEGENAKQKLFSIWQDARFYTEKGQVEFGKIFLGSSKNDFPQPKAVEYIKNIIRTNQNKSCIVLDFFAGSGTTGQAVLELNLEDSGNRHFILCTNNEASICENITYPRLKTVITGKREDTTLYSEGLKANLKYFKTDYIPKASDDDFYSVEEELTKHIKEMIEIERGISIDNEKYLLVLTDEDADTLERIPDKVKNCKAVYISGAVFLTRKQEALLDGIETITIPQYYFEDELMEVGEL